jgi:hypothetical protein
MATKYWVGGGASTNWDATGNTNWSDSSGGANNATVPTTGDDVVFNGLGGAPNGTCVMNVATSLASLVCVSGYTGTISQTFAGTQTLTGNTFTFVAGMTYTPSSSSRTWTFTSTSGTTQITTAGKNFAGIILNGVGGTFQLQDAVSVTFATNSALTLTNGTFSANNQNVTVSNFSSSNANTRVVNMGSGTWTLSGAGGTSLWDTATNTGLTLNRDTSTIVVPTGTGVRTVTMGAGLTLPPISIAALSSMAGNITFNGASTINTLSVTAPNRIQFTAGVTTTISNAPTWSGSSSNRIQLMAHTAGTQATVSVASGTATFDNCIIEDMAFTGGATFTGTNSFNVGNNTSISISEPSGGGVVGVIGS